MATTSRAFAAMALFAGLWPFTASADTGTLWVDKAAPCSQGNGSLATPFCSITQALTAVDNDITKVWTIQIKKNSYVETPLVVPGGAVIRMVGWDGTPTVRANGTLGNTLSVVGNSSVALEHIALSGNLAEPGLYCEHSSIALRFVEISDNDDVGMYVDDCKISAQGSTFSRNSQAAIRAVGDSELELTQSFVVKIARREDSTHYTFKTAPARQSSTARLRTINPTRMRARFCATPTQESYRSATR